MTHTPTAREELDALLADYERDGNHDCAESTLLRWCLARLLAENVMDEGLVREAVRRMVVLDSEQVPS